MVRSTILIELKDQEAFRSQQQKWRVKSPIMPYMKVHMLFLANQAIDGHGRSELFEALDRSQASHDW